MTALSALALMLLAAASAAGQDAGLVLDMGGGSAVPVGAFSSGSEPGQGAAPQTSLSVMFLRPGDGARGIYAGFSQHRFGCEDAGCAAGGRLVATGFDLGLRFALAGPNFVPWIRVGAVTTRVETDALGGADAGVSELAFGGEVGVGLFVRLTRTYGLDPGVRFVAVDTSLPGGSSLGMRYLIAHMALAISF